MLDRLSYVIGLILKTTRLVCTLQDSQTQDEHDWYDDIHDKTFLLVRADDLLRFDLVLIFRSEPRFPQIVYSSYKKSYSSNRGKAKTTMS